jgi:hypothetical protein
MTSALDQGTALSRAVESPSGKPLRCGFCSIHERSPQHPLLSCIFGSRKLAS